MGQVVTSKGQHWGPLGGRLVGVCLANGNDGQMGLPWGRRRTHGTICDALFIPIITAIANSTIKLSNIEPSSLPLLSLLARHPIGLSPSAHPSPTYWGLALPHRPSFCQLPFLRFNTFSLFHFMTTFGVHCTIACVRFTGRNENPLKRAVSSPPLHSCSGSNSSRILPGFVHNLRPCGPRIRGGRWSS